MAKNKNVVEEGLPTLSSTEVEAEMGGVSLGDKRLNERFVAMMRAVAKSPSSSLAAIFEGDADYEGAHRLLRNPNVDWADLIEPHLEATRERAKEAGEVIVIHDTSTIRLSEAAGLDSWIQTGKRGFFAHVSLAVDGRHDRKPLGVMGMELLFRNEKQSTTKRANGRRKTGAETAKLERKEFDRWWRLIEGTGQRLATRNVIHVTDREGDSYELLARLTTSGKSFVIRWSKDRCARLSKETEANWDRVSGLLSKAKRMRCIREVHVGKRKSCRAPQAAAARPSRDSRIARLRFARCQLDLKRPGYLSNHPDCPETIRVQVVRVFEPCPPDDQEPINWVLFTSLPVDTIESAERVVDIYRQRWLIEEYFRAIKSGCAYRKRQLTNPHSILNTLAMFLPVAYKALLLRQIARAAQAPASAVFTSVELKVLKAKARQIGKPFEKTPTSQAALSLIARLGGHRSANGPPGWTTLMKGMEKFFNLVEGWTLAHATS